MNPELEKVKEFLSRKGPAGIPYWGLGLMGAAVIGGVIFVNAKGGLSGLAGGGDATSASGGGGAGSGGGVVAQPPIPSESSIPQSPSVGGVPPGAPPATGGGQAALAPFAPDPVLIQGGGQQASDAGSGVQGAIPVAVTASQPSAAQAAMWSSLYTNPMVLGAPTAGGPLPGGTSGLRAGAAAAATPLPGGTSGLRAAAIKAIPPPPPPPKVDVAHKAAERMPLATYIPPTPTQVVQTTAAPTQRRGGAQSQ